MELNARGVGKNLEYASAMGIPYCIILGGDEVKQKKVLLRDMQRGKQELLAVKDVVNRVKSRFLACFSWVGTFCYYIKFVPTYWFQSKQQLVVFEPKDS